MTAAKTHTTAAVSIDLVWIVVADFKKAIKFYTEIVGLKVLSSHDAMGWAELGTEQGGATLGIAQQSNYCPIAPGQNAVMTFTVDNLEEAIADFKKKGAKLVGEIQEVPGHVKLQLFVDSDGNHSQLVETLN